MMTTAKISELFSVPAIIDGNRIHRNSGLERLACNQGQTQGAFSDKWAKAEKAADIKPIQDFSRDWFLKLFGFSSEAELARFLSTKAVIIDTGCGMGFKAAWFAELSPKSTVIGLDISESVIQAAENYKHLSNLYFVQCDVAQTGLLPASIDFVVCDQVIMHTEVPEETFAHLSSLLTTDGEFACYVYRKKALPRELIDDYFRTQTHHISKDEMWAFSEQMTELGKRLSDLEVSFDCPEIPLLGIKEGNYDIQRFIYWNFLKCFWKKEWGPELCNIVNYDWYAPSNAQRYSREEFLAWVSHNQLQVVTFHEEEACYSGRFKRA
jgi:SAM-dependent methyltransferase